MRFFLRGIPIISVAQASSFSKLQNMSGKNSNKSELRGPSGQYSEDRVSPAQKLEIRDEVERQLSKPPGDAFKWVQREIDERVEDKAKSFWLLAKVAVPLILVIAAIFGIKWSNIQDKFNETTQKFDSAQSNVVARYAEVTNISAMLNHRYEELKRMDTIVTTEQLSNRLQVVEKLKVQTEEALLTAYRLAAQNGDAIAFDRITAWSTNEASSLSWEAARIRTELTMTITGPFLTEPDEESGSVAVSRTVGRIWDLSAGFQQSMDQYRNSRPEEKISVINYIWNATNHYGKAQRLGFLVDAALGDSTIEGRVFATKLLNQEFNTRFSAADPEFLKEWWATNKTTYSTAP
jgi:hypothetical protein